MVDTSPILIIEPVVRGFRLDVLARVVSAIREASNRPVFIVTRADFPSRELGRRIGPEWTDVNFVASSIDLNGADTAMLDDHAVGALLDAAVDVLPHSGHADLVFLGADDYLGALAARWSAYRVRLGHTRPFVFLYNAEDLLAGQLVGRGSARLASEAIAAIEAIDATLLTFDEGLRGQRVGARRAKVLPDPWHGSFALVHRTRARESYGLVPHGLLVMSDVDLLLNEGDSSWLTDIERLAQVPFVYCALQGNVWTLRNRRLRQIATRFGDRLIYVGPWQKIYKDTRLLAATDLLLTSVSRPRGAGQLQDPVAIATQACAVRQTRAMQLGAGFDRDVKRLLLEIADTLRGISGVGRTLMRDELDRLAEERLNRTFGVQLRAAIRRSD
jgi:hypothetical protein